MTVTFDYYVEDIDTKLETYDQVRLFQDTSPAGSFATQVATATLVAGQLLYTLSDDSGDANKVYVVDFHHSTLGNTSERSAPFYPAGVSLLRLRLEAARRANAGFDSVCSAVGTTTSLIDAVLFDSGKDADFLDGAWVYRPFAALATDRVRRVYLGGFEPSTGTLNFARVYSNAPASGEVYHVYNFYPPTDQPGAGMSWDRIIRDALADVWYVDQIDLGTGTTAHQRRFNISDFVEASPSQVRRVLIRTTDPDGNLCDRDADTLRCFWETVQNGPGDLSIDVFPAPLTTESVIVEVNRRVTPFYNDTDVTAAPMDYTVAAVVRRLFWQLNQDQPGKYAGELASAQQLLERAAVSHPLAVVRGV